jgi:hypothetical protein
MTRFIIAVAVAITATATPVRAQMHATESPGAFAIGISAGPATAGRDGVAVHEFAGAVGAEATMAPTWFVRAQYVTTPRQRLTLGIAHSIGALRRRAYLSAEGGFGTVGRKRGVYGGGGLQAPLGGSRFVLTGDARLYITAIDLGVAFFAGVKMHVG